MIKKVFQNRGKVDYLINRNEIMVSHLENKYNWTFLSLKKIRENKNKITGVRVLKCIHLRELLIIWERIRPFKAKCKSSIKHEAKYE